MYAGALHNFLKNMTVKQHLICVHLSIGVWKESAYVMMQLTNVTKKITDQCDLKERC